MQTSFPFDRTNWKEINGMMTQNKGLALQRFKVKPAQGTNRVAPRRFSFSLFFVLTLFSTSFNSESLDFQPFILKPNFINAPMTDLAPFYHGVASGDPLADKVIIWTRVTPENASVPSVEVNWYIATDPNMLKIVQQGTTHTSDQKDFTVKVDVQGLQPNTYYYYQFESLGKKSIIGRTKTAPNAEQNPDLRFAVVSCNNYQDGYFNAYRHLADRADLDAVLHLGDYIYEYGEGKYNANKLGRALSPKMEIVALEDYRMRYSQYRIDADFIKVHQQHPFICIWDDHETANDAHKNGAENHTEGQEGSWEDRKKAAKQAYFEWLPIRNNPDKKINRVLKYGELADIILLDTRLEGRAKQPEDKYAPDFNDSTRTMLGKQQREWLFNALESSTAKWKIIGQQVIFSELNVGWVNPLDRQKSENFFLDIWNGYPVARQKVIDFIQQKQMENIVFLTGDFHASFAFEVAANPTDSSTYNPETGQGAIAVEFVTPSITSANFDEYLGRYRTKMIEKCMLQPCKGFPFFYKKNPNPHLKYVDLDRHGYYIMEVSAEKTQVDYFYVSTILENESPIYYETSYKVNSGTPHLEKTTALPNKTLAIPAPAFSENLAATVSVVGIHQKENSIYLQVFADSDQTPVCLELYDASGKHLRSIACPLKGQAVYTLHFPTENLSKGVYFIEEGGGKKYPFSVN